MSDLTESVERAAEPLPRGGDGLTIVDMNFAQLVTATALLAATLATAQADPSARVVETHPSASATLDRNQSFWVRIEYQADEPIRLWARPFRNGAPVETAMSNTSSAYTGAGAALGWFALTQSGDVDEVRVVAGGDKPYREWVLARYPVELHWTAGPAASDSRPQWVEDLLALDQQRRDEAARQRAAEPVSASEVSLFNGFMLAILALALAGIVVPVWSAWQWRGGWRLAAAVPAAVLGFVILRIIIDTARDPTSHNLWPFEIVMVGAAALAWIAVLKAARKFIQPLDGRDRPLDT